MCLKGCKGFELPTITFFGIRNYSATGKSNGVKHGWMGDFIDIRLNNNSTFHCNLKGELGREGIIQDAEHDIAKRCKLKN